MGIILAIATILGGIAAIWYLFEKSRSGKRLAPTSQEDHQTHLESWRKALQDGNWGECIDCGDEALLQNLRALLNDVLLAHDISQTSRTNVEVALMELCRNVSNHSTSRFGHVDININMAYELKSFWMLVKSKGTVFTLEEALSKYDDIPKGRLNKHGLQNLLSRGRLIIGHEAGYNYVQFVCVLVSSVDFVEGKLAVELHQSRILIGQNPYDYLDWFDDVKAKSYDDLLDYFEGIKRVLLDQWDGKQPVQIKVFVQTPYWTLNEMEIVVINTFRTFVSELERDSGFEVEGDYEIR